MRYNKQPKYDAYIARVNVHEPTSYVETRILITFARFTMAHSQEEADEMLAAAIAKDCAAAKVKISGWTPAIASEWNKHTQVAC